MNNPICFALDGMSAADQWMDMLEEHVGAFKVGLELFIKRCGHGWKFPPTNRDVILDLKLHDIPETVANAVKAGGDLGAKYMTLHIQQREALEKAVRAAEPYSIKLLGVTVLTSMSRDDLKDLCMDYDAEGQLRGISAVEYRVRELVKFGVSCGLRGFVCSPQELRRLSHRPMDEESLFFLVPGIRPAGAALNDQQRVGTPAQAMKDGASMLVIGRPIRDAPNPVQAAKDILNEIQAPSCC